MARRHALSGQTVAITGAGSGIGRALALRLSGQGIPVAICDSDQAGLADTADQLPGAVLAERLDVRDRTAQMAWAAQVAEWAPAPIGAVINNAGVTVMQRAADGSPEDDEWCFDVNYWGVVHGTRAFLPILLEQDSGAIVNVSSVFGLIGWPTQSAYCASKFAVCGYTESLRHELRDSGVRAITVHPGGIATRITEHARFHVDDLGRTEREDIEREFKRVARTSPERAAATIQRGIEVGRKRILIGADAYALATLSRVAPVRYMRAIKLFEPIIRR
jgi:NAD(P)-dependent dehydrogenase (short-subunit alcohol dehydrogenase family)